MEDMIDYGKKVSAPNEPILVSLIKRIENQDAEINMVLKTTAQKLSFFGCSVSEESRVNSSDYDKERAPFTLIKILEESFKRRENYIEKMRFMLNELTRLLG